MTQGAPAPPALPEIGPSLGRLVTGSPHESDGPVLKDLRLHLATQMIEMAGEARRRSAAGDWPGATRALSGERWRAVWEAGVDTAVDRVLTSATGKLQREAYAVRMPRRVLARFMPTPRDRQAIRARLGATGRDLLDRIEAFEAKPRAAGDGSAQSAWADEILALARRLETSYLALEEAAVAEHVTWQARGEEVKRWRKPLWPVLVVGVILLGGALWIGAVLGGFIPVPTWFRGLWELLP